MKPGAVDQLARDWWVIHRDSGLAEQRLDPLSSIRDWMDDVDTQVRDQLGDRIALASFLEALVQHARDDMEVMFVGTSVVEHAIHEHGGGALRVMDDLALSQAKVELLWSGVLPSLRALKPTGPERLD